MSKFIVIFGNDSAGKKEAEARIHSSWCSRWLETSDERVLALEADETAQEISLRLFPEDGRRRHLVLRIGVGSYYGNHAPELWDFLAK